MNLFSFLWGTRIRVVPPPQSIYLIFGQKELFLSDIGREAAAAGRRAGGHGSFSSLYLYPTMKCLQRHLSDGRLPTGIQYSLRTGIENNRVNVQIVMTYERSKTFA